MKTKGPPGLSAESRRLWNELQAEYRITDAAGLRFLRTACEALDQQRRAEAVVREAGMVAVDRYGAPRAHPLLAVARDSRAAMLKALAALNLDIEPLRDRAGRPPRA